MSLEPGFRDEDTIEEAWILGKGRGWRIGIRIHLGERLWINSFVWPIMMRHGCNFETLCCIDCIPIIDLVQLLKSLVTLP